MNDNRPSDVVKDNLSRMIHIREAISAATKSNNYNSEKISEKEKKKLPEVSRRIEKAIEIGELLESIVGNSPYRTYNIFADSYSLICSNLIQRIGEIDKGERPSKYKSLELLLSDSIEDAKKYKAILNKWIVNRQLNLFISLYEEDVDRLNRLIDFYNNQFVKWKNYPGDELVFKPFPDSVAHYASQLFCDIKKEILTRTELTDEIGAIAKYVADNDRFSTCELQCKFHKGHGFIMALVLHWENLGIIGGPTGNRPRKLLMKSYDDIITTIQNHNNEIREIIEPDN